MKQFKTQEVLQNPGNSTTRAAETAKRGFTLLEVLAAVAILGVWYMVMATIAMQGLRAEGQSQRRLRASLIADRVVADLEANLAARIAPVAGEEEETLEEFTILTSVEPYILILPAAEGSTGEAAQSRPALERLEGQGGLSPISQIRVEVTWIDGIETQSVVRETFGVDLGPSMQALQVATPTAAVQADSNDEATPEASPESVVTFPEDDSS